MSDLISRQAAIRIASGYCHPANVAKELAKLPSVQPDVPDTNVGDLISRQAAIDICHKNYDGILDFRSDGWTVASSFEDIINSVPSVQPEPQWIPCSERLPEENVPVNITWVNHNPPEYYANIKDVPQTATGVCFRGRWYWYSVDIEDVLAEYGLTEYVQRNLKELIHEDIEITAWMPLPEPYEERRER